MVDYDIYFPPTSIQHCGFYICFVLSADSSGLLGRLLTKRILRILLSMSSADVPPHRRAIIRCNFDDCLILSVGNPFYSLSDDSAAVTGFPDGIGSRTSDRQYHSMVIDDKVSHES